MSQTLSGLLEETYRSILLRPGRIFQLMSVLAVVNQCCEKWNFALDMNSLWFGRINAELQK